jgi:mono/diheme cytochrome c family protein
MNKNKYLLLGSSWGVLVLLVVAAVQENFLKDWRRVQASGRSDEGPIPVQVRQIVNPGLRTADRCVSCHVGMGPGEKGVVGDKVLAAHKPVVHDPAEFGCTVCHGGQAPATEKADAHGEVKFWPEPMLPASFSYAGCGTCHAPLRVPNAETLRRASAAFERLDCRACHKVDGRGGLVRPDGGGMEGPDLSATGLRTYDREWYPKHLAEAAKAQSGPWRTSWAAIDRPDLELLENYLATRVGAPRWIEAKAAFHSSGCLGCHKVSGVGGDEGPDLTRVGEKDPGQLDFTHVPGDKALPGWFEEHFRSPAALAPGSQMPPVAASEREIGLLTFYLFSLRRRELPSAYLPKDRVRAVRFGEREFTTDGATLFSAFCSGCHGPDGLGRRAPGMPAFPAIASRDFLERVSDEFLLNTVRRGRPGRRMPAWGEKEGGLTPEEIRAVVAEVRRMGNAGFRPDGMPARWVKGDAALGKRLYESSCAGCHGPSGEGGEGPALRNPVLLESATDSYLVATIGRGRRGTGMQGFLEPSPVRPALDRPEIESIVMFLRSWQGGKP